MSAIWALPPHFDPDAPAAEDGGLFGLPHGVDGAAVVVIPVPFEATASFHKGTARAPEAVAAASMQVDLFDLETGSPWRAGIAMAPVDERIPGWNVQADAAVQRALARDPHGADPNDPDRAEVNAISEAVNESVRAQTALLLRAGRIPAVLGGDHSAPFGAIAEAASWFPGMGVLHVDAHADLRVGYQGFRWSHASILYNVLTEIPSIAHIVQVGLRDMGSREWALIQADPRLSALTDVGMTHALASGRPLTELFAEALAPLPADVWLTIDIDGLDPAFCPGTGTPVPGGLSWGQLLVLLSMVSASGRRIVGFDLCEVGESDWDSNVGARVLYKLAGHALKSQGR